MKAQTSRFPQRRAHGAPLRRKLIAALVAACYTGAQAAPLSPTVVAGQASFNLTGKTYSITNTPNTIINWQSFSVAADEITRFIQQSADSKVLNRITGQDPTQILGSLQSNGKVFLINPNGVLFGAGSRVDVNGLVASSLAISNTDFLAGKNNFVGAASAGKVSNAGAITTPAGGQIFLIAPAVENSGVISAPNGDVVLAAGRSVQLFDSKDPNVQVVVSAPADQALNLGQIVAQGGRVGVYGALVSQRGGISANSAVRGANGQIILKASGTTLLEAGSTTTATGSNLNTGGDIQLLGARVGLTGNAVVDASGAAGGGTVLVGGDYQGKNAAVQNAQQAYVGKDSVIKADATAGGDGGKVIVWSDRATQMFGSISARGGAAGGHGGFVETSGHYLDMQGYVDTRAPNGATGKLLLDPSDVYIADNGGVAGVPGSISTSPGMTGGPMFLETASVQESLLKTSTLATALASNDVTVSTANNNGSGSGKIVVLSPVAVPNNRNLMLTADNDINLNAAVSLGTSSGLTLTAGANIALNTAMTLGTASTASFGAGGDIALNAAVTGTGGALALTSGGSISQHTSPIDALAVSSLSAMAATNIVLNNPSNTFGNAVTLTATNGNVALEAVNINLGGGTAGGTLSAIAHNGDITVSGNISSVGAMTLTSDKTNGLITVNADVAVGSSAGNITLQADNMALNGMLSAITGHGVALAPFNPSVNIQVGEGATDGAGVLGLTKDELATVHLPANGSLTVGGNSNGPGNSTGGLTVVGNLNLTGGQNAGSLTLQTGGGDLTVNNGAAVANTGVISLQTQPGGDHRITNNGSVTSAANINLFAGKMTLAGGTLNASSVSLESLNPVDIGATGNPSNTLALTNADLNSVNGDTIYITNNNQVAPGNIAVSAPLTLSNGLNLRASGSIALQAAVSTGGLTLNAGTTVSATDSVTVNGAFSLQSGDWSQVGSLPAFSAYDFSIGVGNNFLRAAGGDGSSGAPYQIVDVYGLQGMGSLSRNSQSFVLNNDIDASQTAHWNQTGPSAFAGFKPIGDSDHLYNGTFDGNYKTISGLTIHRPADNHVGLFWGLGSGTVQNVKLTGATVEGNSYTGALAGSINNGSSVSGVAIDANVTGNDAYVGGLAGYSTGSVSNSYMLGNVTGKSANSTGTTGGLLGGLDTYGHLNATYSSAVVKSNTSTVIDALVGDGANGGEVVGSFFLTGGAASDTAGAVGLTTAQMTHQASFSGFDFASGPVWRIYEGHTAPLLKGFLTPLTVNVTGSGSSKVYDGTTVTFGQTYAHANISGTLGYDGAINTGDYNVGGLYSTKYDISYDATATLHITPRPITATVVSASKTYDTLTSLIPGTANGAISYNIVGALNGDTLGISATMSFADKLAGSGKTITFTSPTLTNNPHNNYVLSGVSGSGTINKADLAINGLSAVGRVYDGTVNNITLNGTGSVTGLSSDVVSLTGSGTATLQDKNAGPSKLVLVSLTNYGLTGTDAGNYNLISPPTLTAAISKAPLSVGGSFTANSRVYNMDYNAAAGQYGTLATLNIGNGTLSGVIGSDVVNLASGSGTFDNRNVGTGKTVLATGFTLGGADGGNYMVSNLPTGLTASITPAPLTATLVSRQYNNTTNATLSGTTLAGLLGMPEGPLDSVSLLISEGSSASYADKNVGVNKTVNFSGGMLSLSGADAGNYSLNPGVKGTITARPLSTWTGNSSNGLWSDAGNWSSNIAPDGANVLAASLLGAGIVTYNGSTGATTLNTVTVGEGSQLLLTGGTLTIASGGSKSYLTGATLKLDGGNLVLNGAMEGSNLILSNGVLSGTNSAANLTINNLTQTGGSIDMSGSLLINAGGNIAIGSVRAQNGITLNAVEVGAITQSGPLVTDSLHATAASGITLTNTGNHVNAFYGSNGNGSIRLNNTVSTGELELGPLSTTNGSIVIDNHGGIHTAGALAATGGGVSLTAHSPITINNSLSGQDIALSASTDITLASGSALNANNSINMLAVNNIVLGGVLNVTSPSGSISAVATNGSISVGSATAINSNGAAVTLAAPYGTVSASSVSLGSGTVPSINSGTAAAAAAQAAAQAAADAAAAAKAAADAAAAKAAADAVAKAAADAAAKAAADAVAKAAADAAAKAAADAVAKAAADAAAKAAADAAADAATKAAADAAAKAAADAAQAAAEAASKADAAAKAAADAAAHAAADAAAKAAADAAAKAAADAAAQAAAQAAADAAAQAAASAAAKAAADAAAAAAAGNQTSAPVSQALSTTVNIINTVTSVTQGGTTKPQVVPTPTETATTASSSGGGGSGGGTSKPDDKVPDEKDKTASKTDVLASKNEPVKKMYCN